MKCCHNKFIPDHDDPFRHLLAPPVIMIRSVTIDGQRFYTLADNMGQIVSLFQLLEILTAVKPFYDTIPDREIEEENARAMAQQRIHHEYRGPDHVPIPGFVYLLQAGPFYKIGVSRNVDSRMKQLAALPPFDLDLICTIETDDMFGLEEALHARFDDKRKKGEWFELDPDDVEHIRGLQ